MQTQLDPNQQNAARQHYELYAGPTVTNARWFLICIGLSLVSLTLAGTLASTWRAASHQRIVVLQKAADGGLDRTQYVDLGEYRPGEKEIEHFAYLFVISSYSRVRATLAADFTNHLAFLPDDQRKQELANEKQNKWIEAFEQSTEPEVRIRITKMRFGGGTQQPFHVSVDFEKHFSTSGREESNKKESWTADLTYVLTPESQISSDLVPINPLGLIVTESRESKGY